MVSTNDIRPGQSLIIDGTIYLILEYQHVKPGKGKAFVKTKLKNLSDGGVVDKTFRADENVEQAFIDKQSFNYLYNCLLYTSPSPRDRQKSRMPSSA